MGKQLLVSPAGTAKKGIALLVSPAGTARKALAGFIGDGNGIARQFWPVASAPDISGMTLTLTNPITAGQTGTLRAMGAVTTDDGTVTYEIVSVSGAGVTAAKTTGIAAGEAVAVYTTYSTTADVSVTVTVRAVSSTGAASAAETVTATVKRVVTVSTPSVSGGGTINSEATGSISVYGSVASDGTAVTYEVTGYYGIASISPTAGIANNGVVSFRVNTVTTYSTWSITVRARSASGVYSATKSISGTIFVAPVIVTPPTPTWLFKWLINPTNSKSITVSKSGSLKFVIGYFTNDLNSLDITHSGFLTFPVSSGDTIRVSNTQMVNGIYEGLAIYHNGTRKYENNTAMGIYNIVIGGVIS